MSFLEDMENDFVGVASGEFSEPATITVSGSDPISVDVIFDRTSIEIGNEGAPVLSKVSRALLSIKLIDAAIGREISEKDDIFLTIRGQVFRVKTVDRDGLGGAEIRLNRN